MVQIKISKNVGLKKKSKEIERLSQTFSLLLRNQYHGVYLKLLEYPVVYLKLHEYPGVYLKLLEYPGVYLKLL